MSLFASQILGTGRCLPSRALTNAEIEKMVETSDSWIVERTGIRERRIAEAGQTTTDFALEASKQALGAANLSSKDIDMIIFATVTPDTFLPNAACVLQARLDCGPCAAWDLNAACSGFLYALSVANQFVRVGLYKNILVVGAEILSRIVNYRDRDTCILFGDGAGAAVVGRAVKSSAILSETLAADGTLSDLLVTPAYGVKSPISHETIDEGQQFVTMKGREIFKSAVRTMARAANEVLLKANLTPDDIQWVLPHQANQRIIEAVAKLIDLPMSKIISNVEYVGNTSSASVPIALDEAIRDGRIKRGDLVLITVFGAGLTSGAMLLRY